MANWTAQEAFSWGMYGDKMRLGSALCGAASYDPHHRSMNDVRRELRDAIARGSINARGFKVNLNKPPFTRELLPAGLFDQYSALAVNVSGEAMFIPPSSPQNLPKWEKIIFVESEVRALWPTPTPNLDQWMLDDGRKHPDKKRDSRIEDCCKAKNCTWREALAAYKRLPPDIKRSRGQKIKKST